MPGGKNLLRKNLLLFLLIAVLIGGVGFFAFSPLAKMLKLGLDLQGGAHVVYKAKPGPEGKVTNEDMAQLVAIMRQRVDEMGISEPVIQREGNDRLIIEIAGVKDPEKALETIGRTALLEFKTYDGQVVLTGKDLKNAKPSRDPSTNKPQIDLQFGGEGARKFGEVTTRLVRDFPDPHDPRRIIAIYLDQELLTSPFVQEPITGGDARITGDFAFEEAANIAALLRSGALPVEVEIIEKRTVGPWLGKDSLNKSMVALAIGAAAILLFMLLYYRLPGLIADLALVVYALIVLLILIGLHATLTLPGIAGLLLSVGMAVDANILIFERLKEELRQGKSLWAGVETGFQRAFQTILDSNLTTLIAAVVLYFLGVGPIRGFAVTLSIGILVSMFTAVVLTRLLLRLAVRIDLFRNLRFYGVRG